MTKIKILRDTREQKPWKFTTFDVVVSIDTLPVGDYTIVGHDQFRDDNSIIIERKANCVELCGNLGTGWDRFEREAAELAKFKYKQIIVCGPNNFDYLCARGMTKMSVNFLYKQLAYLFTEYGLSCTFFPSALEAENYAFRLFKEVSRRTENEA